MNLNLVNKDGPSIVKYINCMMRQSWCFFRASTKECRSGAGAIGDLVGECQKLSQEGNFKCHIYSRQAELAGTLDSLLSDLKLSNQNCPFRVKTPVVLRASKLSLKGVSKTA
jgi:hypothetical protein